MKSAAVLLIAALVAGPALAAEAQAPSPPDPAKGQTLAAPCMACHVADGSRGNPAYPILQGQHADYIVKQLTEFKAGKRKNAIMNGMAAALTPDAMKDIAAFYSSKQAKSGFAKDKDTLAFGEKLYRGGDAEQRIPACAGCHSPDGAGIPAQYPRLAGQHTAYLETQLNAFRSGARTNSPQMIAIAGRMRDAEIKAVADYITGLR